ncbi:MAG TPA: DNRLRE domain-containing protein [Myxococcaceae bacterium]|jgi:hypothetical protein
MAFAFRSVALVGLSLALSAQAGPGVTVIFQDGAFPTTRYAGTSDIIITEHVDFARDPDANYSSNAFLQVDGFSARQTSLLRFPIGNGMIPTGADISGAELWIYVREATATGPILYEVLRPWDKDQATYLQARPGEPWDGGGASSPGADRGVEVIGQVPLLPLGWTRVPFTDAGVDLVRRWHGGASPNNGLVIQDLDSWDELFFDSATGPNPPELKVTYDGGAGPAALLPNANTMLAYQPANFDGWGVGASGLGGVLTASFVRWDLEAIPPGVKVEGVQVDFTVNRIGYSVPMDRFELYEVRKPWTESADWFKYDGQNPWGMVGAGATTDHGPALEVLPPCPNPGDTCTIDFRPQSLGIVEGWVRTPASNKGFLLQNYTTLSDLQLFDSETPKAQLRPRLVVSFSAPPGYPTALFPAFADVGTGDRLQMTALGGDGGYVFSVTGGSGASIGATGLYMAGPTPGQDIVRVVDQGGAGTPATATIVVHQGVAVPDGGQPSSDGGNNGGFPVQLVLAGPQDAVAPQAAFTVTADVTNQASFRLFGLTLQLAPGSLEVGVPTLGGGPLPGGATGYALPSLASGETVHLVIPGTMTGAPPASPSLTATLIASGGPVATATIGVPLGEPLDFKTGCRCGAGTGGLAVVGGLALALAFRRRRPARPVR